MKLDEAKQLAREGTAVHRAAWIQPFARLITGVASKQKLTRTCRSSSAPQGEPQPKANEDEPVLLLAITDDEVAGDDAPRWVPMNEDVDADDYQVWEKPAEPQVVEAVPVVETGFNMSGVNAAIEGGNG